MKEISTREDLNGINPVTLFADTWGALTSGNDADGYNSMAVAWGSLGALWERGSRATALPVCTVYVRPSRYTYHLLKENPLFTLSFMGEEHRRAVAVLGTKSGRDDPDKIARAGLSLVKDSGTAYIAGADLVLICRKIYYQPLTADALEPCARDIIDYDYPEGVENFHHMFIGEIIKALAKD